MQCIQRLFPGFISLHMLLVLWCSIPLIRPAFAQPSHEITVSGTRFLLNDQPFPYTGVSFFNAIYNPAFNESATTRTEWLQKFKRYGVNVLRVWGQWDNARGFVDACSECTLYLPDGNLRMEHVNRLMEIIQDADRAGMVVLLALFSRESWNEDIRLSPEAQDRAVTALTHELLPHRNVIFQVWNEFSHRVLDHLKTIKSIDPDRLVTNSPGYGGDLGDYEQNEALDFLTPHTTRSGQHWEIAPREIGMLLTKFQKPVVDDEPARTGTRNFGGPRGENYPIDHILRIYNVWNLGGYVTYHHDMFQTGYGTPAIPPSGIPDPEFSPYHQAVFDFLAQRERLCPSDECRGTNDE
jgi:hypothetical protein